MTDLLSRLAEAIAAEADKPRAERVGLAHVMIAVVQPDLAARDAEIRRLTAERHRYRDAWRNARTRARDSAADEAMWRRIVTSTEQDRDHVLADNDRLTAELQQNRQQTETLAGIVALHLHTGWHLPKRTAEEKTRAKWAAGEANALAAALHAAEINVFADHNPAPSGA